MIYRTTKVMLDSICRFNIMWIFMFSLPYQFSCILLHWFLLNLDYNPPTSNVAYLQLRIRYLRLWIPLPHTSIASQHCLQVCNFKKIIHTLHIMYIRRRARRPFAMRPLFSIKHLSYVIVSLNPKMYSRSILQYLLFIKCILLCNYMHPWRNSVTSNGHSSPYRVATPDVKQWYQAIIFIWALYKGIVLIVFDTVCNKTVTSTSCQN
jgi:hypothetical protein